MRSKALLLALLVGMVLLAGCSEEVSEPTPEFDTAVEGGETDLSVGDTYQTTVTVSNEGAESGDHTVELRIDDEVVDARTVTVDSSGSATVMFEHTFDAPGEYTVRVAGDESHVIVTDPVATALANHADADSFILSETLSVTLTNADGEDGLIRMETDAAYDVANNSMAGTHDVTVDADEMTVDYAVEEWYTEGIFYERAANESASDGYEYDSYDGTWDDALVVDAEAFLSVMDTDEPAADGETLVYTTDEFDDDARSKLFDAAGFTDEFDADGDVVSLTTEAGVTDGNIDYLSLSATFEEETDDGLVTADVALHVDYGAYGEPVETAVPQSVRDGASNGGA